MTTIALILLLLLHLRPRILWPLYCVELNARGIWWVRWYDGGGKGCSLVYGWPFTSSR